MRSRRPWTRLAWTCSPSSGRGRPSRFCRRSSIRSNEKVTKNIKAVRIAGLFCVQRRECPRRSRSR
uniref:Uncharacterized protein n=1 Tax=Ralstonia solanacearum TaxID=305 RepID=O82962_RALSL|nr:unnamed protein product [Ralstonia solanacearum]